MPFNTIKLSPELEQKLQSITNAYNALEEAVLNLPDCREKMLTITNLEQSYMWLTKIFQREQIEQHYKQEHANLTPAPTKSFTNFVDKQSTKNLANECPIPLDLSPNPIPNISPNPQPVVQSTLSPDASVIAESRKNLDNLMDELKKLTTEFSKG